MGMDIYGQAPTAPEGEYFRRNVWGWAPLAALVTTLCPDEAAACQSWFLNDGDGLDAAGAAALAAKLQALQDSGDIANYCVKRDAQIAMPRLVCDYCGGTGNDGDGPGLLDCTIHGSAEVLEFFGPPLPPRPGEPCRRCKGVGMVEDDAKNYFVDPSDVDQFIAFLKASGGFAIW
jgi:hypothetical protein